MYHITDKQAAIREVQKYLHFASDRGVISAERVAIDGIYGDETRNAVASFQAEKDLKETGVVDYKTFVLLYEAYLSAQSIYYAEDYFISTALFPFKFGDTGHEVLLLNLMLEELRRHYTEVSEVALKPYYSHATENAVNDIRKIYGLESSQMIDLELYEKMRYELFIRGAEK